MIDDLVGIYQMTQVPFGVPATIGFDTKRLLERFLSLFTLSQLAQKRSGFKLLCEDYGECVEMVTKLTLSDPSLPAQIEEFRILRDELEAEILQVLSKAESEIAD